MQALSGTFAALLLFGPAQTNTCVSAEQALKSGASLSEGLLVVPPMAGAAQRSKDDSRAGRSLSRHRPQQQQQQQQQQYGGGKPMRGSDVDATRSKK